MHYFFTGQMDEVQGIKEWKGKKKSETGLVMYILSSAFFFFKLLIALHKCGFFFFCIVVFACLCGERIRLVTFSI